MEHNSPLAGCPVLVTGAGGFIASHLIERLVAEGARIRAFLRYTSQSDVGCLRLLPPEVSCQVEPYFGDLRDQHAVMEAVRGVHTVFHLGALIAIPYSYRHPREVVETNVLGTLNVLMAARNHSLQRLVHTSSSEVYGTAQYVPIDETHPLQGQSPYSASKIGADKLVESFVRSFNVPAVTIRPFNTFGPRQSARAVIPTIISQALVQDEICLGALAPTRDFTYVTDTVDGFIRGAVAACTVGRTYNLGTGREISVGELASLIADLVGRSVRISTDTERLRPVNSEVQRLCADNRQAQRDLGWEPRVSLEEGLSWTIEWIRAHPEYFVPKRYAL